jgi:ParB/RepB/Spo0J family partition protein
LVRPYKGNRFQLIAGERRLRAAALAQLETVPCIVRKLTDLEAEEIQVIENDQREDLNPIERGAGYLKLIERHGHTPETLAAAVKKSKTFIYDQIKLAKLPERARKALLEGKIPQSTATLIARIPSEKRREAAAEEIVGAKPYPSATYENETLSFRQAKSLIERKFSLQLKGTPFSREDATLVPAAGACTTCPKLTGNNRVEFPDGRADVCTDPQCFNQKIAAHDARTRTKAKESEIKVLSASESKRIFSSYGSALRHDSGYIDLAEQCGLDKQKKKRSYKQLLGDQVNPVLAIDRNHRARYLVPAKEAAKVLENTHKIKIHVASSSSGLQRGKKKDPQAEAKRQLEHNVFELAVQLAGEEIALQAEVVLSSSRPLAETFSFYLRKIAFLMFENALNIGDGDAEERIAIRLGLISPPKEKSTAKKKHLSRNVPAWRALQKLVEKGSPSSTAEQIFGAVLQMEFAADSYGNKLDDRQQRILKMFPRVGAFETYLVRAREELTKPPDPPPAANTKAKAAGRSK